MKHTLMFFGAALLLASAGAAERSNSDKGIAMNNGREITVGGLLICQEPDADDYTCNANFDELRATIGRDGKYLRSREPNTTRRLTGKCPAPLAFVFPEVDVKTWKVKVSDSGHERIRLKNTPCPPAAEYHCINSWPSFRNSYRWERIDGGGYRSPFSYTGEWTSTDGLCPPVKE